MKMQYFQGDDDCGFEPMCGTVGIANGTAYSIGHLIAAHICYGGPGSGFCSLDIQIHYWWFKKIVEKFSQRTITWFIVL